MAEKIPKNNKDNFYFIIDREGSNTSFRFYNGGRTGGKTRQIPDFRRFTGAERELLREFLAHKQELEYAYDFDGADSDTYSLTNPDERLIRRTLEAGLLRNARGEVVQEAEGSFRCALRMEDVTANHVNVSLVLLDESGAIAATGRRPTLKKEITENDIQKKKQPAADNCPPAFYTLSPCFAMAGSQVYPIKDLGLRWADTDRIYARIQKTEAPAFLSMVFSAFTNLELMYEGWTMKRIRPASALPALLFMEIDRYGYLHVRPVSFLRGFSPLFLESQQGARDDVSETHDSFSANGDIVSVVEMNDADKVLGIAEVIFPEPPDELFRT
ncbi:MAG: hypothetical protein FWF26_02385, partial [Treponema sp.]|nr:hypothetical protein [Treponema sp.]